MDPLQHTVDGDMARRFLDFLDPDHDAFLFAAGDDNEERAREARKDSKAAWVDHRHGCIDAQLAWLNQQQALGWGHLHQRSAHAGQAPASQERLRHPRGLPRVGHGRHTAKL